MTKAMENNAPDIVLSGVNRGGNLGEDVTYSGTVAAAMEATCLVFPPSPSARSRETWFAGGFAPNGCRR